MTSELVVISSGLTTKPLDPNSAAPDFGPEMGALA